MFLIGGILLIYAKFTDSIFFIFDKLVINFVAEYFEVRMLELTAYSYQACCPFLKLRC